MTESDAAAAAPGPGVLAVDLDGTLIRSDMLDESFWAAFARDWRTPVRALWGLRAGKAALKAELGRLGLPDPNAAGVPTAADRALPCGRVSRRRARTRP